MESYKEITNNIPTYIKLLSEDFENNEHYAFIFSKLFLNDYSLKKFIVEDRVITDFYNYDSNKPVPYDPSQNAIKKIDNINFDFKILKNINPSEVYYFFSKKEFLTLEDAKENKTDAYYIFENNFSKKLDEFFLSYLPDYKKTAKKNIYEKKISDEYFLIFDIKKEYKKLESIESYTYPNFYLIKNGHIVKLFYATDIFDLLFLPANSFLQFYTYYNKVILNDKNEIIEIRRTSYDEPIIYHNLITNKYEVTNRFDTLTELNKFIFITTELFLHYFRIFEKWLINTIKNIA